MPKNTLVLDVGCGGLWGENTTDYLIEHFGDERIQGLVKEGEASYEFSKQHPNIKFSFGDFHTHEFPITFDLVVLDLDIRGNLINWSEEGLKRVKDLVSPGGYLINYVMMTDQYGDPEETPKLIREHAERFWLELTPEAVGRKLDQLEDFEFVAFIQEERRSYIYWVLLRRRE